MRRASSLPTAPSKVRCAIYTRKSSEEGLEQNFNSLHAQREACEAYVLSQIGEGWSALPAIYDDGGYSGGNMERPALARLMADVDAGRIDVVVVYKVDRLTRALADFAKIVERFDAQGVSFVSVTQAFNTTSSMGRLTLNVLLSFAQFEREVTGERIRDKIAASKAKGMWMGGPPPLGYDGQDRTLVVNPAEAAVVRDIFDRYLRLGSVHALRDELEAQAIHSKRHVTLKGKALGGKPFGRGALFHLLSNRIYVGEIVHKTQSYPGLHEPIVERELFDRAQRMLRHNTPPKIARPKTTAEMQLTGRVFDDRGNPMSPVISKRRGHGYRYYVSAALLTGRKHQVGSLPRFPAPALEELVADRLSRLEELHDREGDLADRIRRIEVSRDTVRVDLAWDPAPALLPRFGRLLPAEDRAECDVDGLRLTIAAVLQPRGGVKLALGPEGLPAVQRVKQDPTLVQALVRAEAWKHVLFTQGADSLERLHTAEGVDRSYARRLMRLAFLSPALKRAVLEGVALPDLTLQNLMVGYLPLAWAEQEATYRLPKARAL